MKLQIKVETFEETQARALERARKLSRREPVEPERSLIFETVDDLLECLTRERVRLCEAAREGPRSVSALALALGRDRRAVTRDVKRLAEFGLLRLRKQNNPGHGQMTMVEAAADRFDLRLEF